MTWLESSLASCAIEAVSQRGVQSNAVYHEAARHRSEKLHGPTFILKRLSEALARYLSGLCAHALQKAGLIQYSRGRIKILNRDGLKESACECCEVIREHVDKAAPPLT